VSENPTVEVVMTEVLEAIKSSCAPIEIEPDAQAEFLSVYQPKFGARLRTGSWHTDRANILTAAQQHGVIANAIATLRRQKRVDAAVLLEAGGLVRKHCSEVFKEGVWCS